MCALFEHKTFDLINCNDLSYDSAAGFDKSKIPKSCFRCGFMKSLRPVAELFLLMGCFMVVLGFGFLPTFLNYLRNPQLKSTEEYRMRVIL